jgi:hypothetical protein
MISIGQQHLSLIVFDYLSNFGIEAFHILIEHIKILSNHLLCCKWFFLLSYEDCCHIFFVPQNRGA